MASHHNKTQFSDLNVFNFFTKNEETFSSFAEIIFKFYSTSKEQHRFSPTNMLEFFIVFLQYLASNTSPDFVSYCQSYFIQAQHRDLYRKCVSILLSFFEEQKAALPKGSDFRSQRDTLREKIATLRKFYNEVPAFEISKKIENSFLESPLFQELCLYGIGVINEKAATEPALTSVFTSIQEKLRTALNKPSLRLCAADGSVLHMKPSNKDFAYNSKRNKKPPQAKLHALIDIVTLTPLKLTLTKANKNERNYIGDTPEDVLLLVDKGYLKFDLMQDLNKKGCSYIFRATSNTNPGHVIQAYDENNKEILDFKGKEVKHCRLDIENGQNYAHLTIRDRSRIYDGQPMMHSLVMCFNRAAYFSQLRYLIQKEKNEERRKRRSYKGLSRFKVGFQDPKSQKEKRKNIKERARKRATFYFYTNIPSLNVAADVISELYRYRWQIELFFKGLKSGCNLVKCSAIKSEIRVNHFLASILTSLLKRRCISQLVTTLNITETISYHKILRHLSEKMAILFRECLLNHFDLKLKFIVKFFKNNMPDLKTWIIKFFKRSKPKNKSLARKLQNAIYLLG